MPPRVLTAALVLLAAAPGLRASQAPGEDWQELLERSASASFAPSTAASALKDLRDPDIDSRGRALALFALGAGRVVAERARLESWAQQGGVDERCAAVLGLGELDTPEPELLVRLARQEPAEVAECALLALLRSGRPSGIAHVAGVARGEGPLAEAARELARFREAPASVAPRAARRLLELRYEAGRRHGLVGGRLWAARVLEERLADDGFLDAVIYRAASELRKPGVRDHFLELLLDGAGPAAVRGAVNAMPVQVAQLVENDLWTPPDEAVWGLLLAEIDERRLEGLVQGLLHRALTLPALRGWAALLLVRSGQASALPLLASELESAPPATRVALARGLGATGEPSFIPLLGRQLGGPPELEAAVLVAQLRLDHPAATRAVGAALAPADELDRMADPAGSAARQHLRLCLIDELSRAARAREAAVLLDGLLPELRGAARVAALAGLCEAGVRGACEALQAMLRQEAPGGDLGRRAVAALVARAGPQDLPALREMFPRENAREVDIELAVALLARRDAGMRPILRAALWREPFHRSLLAAGLMHDAGGDLALRLELESPPRSASPGDLRRVGFAAGVWGGRAAADALAARAGTADPAVQGAQLGALLHQTF
jgi:hypothetical protein